MAKTSSGNPLVRTNTAEDISTDTEHHEMLKKEMMDVLYGTPNSSYSSMSELSESARTIRADIQRIKAVLSKPASPDVEAHELKNSIVESDAYLLLKKEFSGSEVLQQLEQEIEQIERRAMDGTPKDEFQRLPSFDKVIETLVAERKALNFTIRGIAEKSGLHKSQVERIEAGKKVDEHHLNAYANALGKTLGYTIE